MTIALAAINHTNVVVLRILDALLARHEHLGKDGDGTALEVDIESLRMHLQVCGDGISEAEI